MNARAHAAARMRSVDDESSDESGLDMMDPQRSMCEACSDRSGTMRANL